MHGMNNTKIQVNFKVSPYALPVQTKTMESHVISLFLIALLMFKSPHSLLRPTLREKLATYW
jgi:hypothetical protein